MLLTSSFENQTYFLEGGEMAESERLMSFNRIDMLFMEVLKRSGFQLDVTEARWWTLGIFRNIKMTH